MAPSSSPSRSGRSVRSRIRAFLRRGPEVRVPVPAIRIPLPSIDLPAIRIPLPSIELAIPVVRIPVPVVAAVVVAPTLAVVASVAVTATPAAAATAKAPAARVAVLNRAAGADRTVLKGRAAAVTRKQAVTPCTVSAKLVPSCGALLGLSTETAPGQTWDQAVTATEASIGTKADVLHDYHQWNTAFPNPAEAARAASGQKLIYSWIGKRQDGTTVSWSKIAAGAEDAVIDAEATRVADMHTPVFVNFQNEPESSIGTSGTAAEYVAAWRHIHDRFVAKGASNAVWTVVYMGVTSDNKLAETKALYPGNDYVDYIAWDPYNWGSCRDQAPASFVDTVSPFYNWLMDNGYGAKPFMLAEYGTVEDPADPTAKADWFTAENKALAQGRFPNLKVLSYFDHPAPPASCTWSLRTSPASIASYAALAKDAATRSSVPTTVPGAPTAVTAVAGVGSAVVSWTPPTNTGGGVISGYRVTASPGGRTIAVAASPVNSMIVTGLSAGTSYRFAVAATTVAGTGAASASTPNVTAAVARIAVPAPGAAGWQLNGTTALVGGGLQLTDATTKFSRGSAFATTPITSASQTLVSFDADSSGGTGADGLTLTFGDAGAGATTTSLGASGGGLGWSGTPGFAVALDTYGNGSDPSSNFVGLATGASSTDAHNLTWKATSTAVPSLRTRRHITVAIAGGTITVAVDGIAALRSTVTLPARTLIGFTAGDGYRTDQHLVSDVVITAS